MRMPRLIGCLVLGGMVLWAAAHPFPACAQDEIAQETDAWKQTVRPFLATYCVKCHGSRQQKAERRFDLLNGIIDQDSVLVDYQDILDQLNLGDMPPADEKQPPVDERLAVIEWMTGRITEFQRQQQPSSRETVLRRLNSREYHNTVRDLLRLNMTMFRPTEAFPRDQLDEHRDNVGETLVTSGHLLNRYLEAAESVIDKALWPLQKPETQTWSFHDNFRQQPEIDKVHGSTNGFGHITLYDVKGADKHEGAYGPILAFQDGVPHDGWYEIRFRADALHRINPYDREFLGRDPNQPLRLGIVAGNVLAGPLHKPQPIEPLLAELDLADGSDSYSVRVWLDRGYTPRFTFENGLMDARTLWSRVIRRYPDQFPKLSRPGIVEARYTAIKYSKLPQIHVDDIEIEGPLIESWPTESQRAVLGDDCESIMDTGSMSPQQMRRQLDEFVGRAYRRDARPDEVERLMQLIAVRRADGCSILEAYRDALAAVLCSPGFLYLDEPDDNGTLTAHSLASRLSYFLWSSMPDEPLLKLAESGALQQADVLEAQVERLLDDSKSSAFVDGFLESWLTLRDLGSMPPDRTSFRAYYHYDLGTSMRRETQLFTRHLLDHNKSVMHFLDADFTFVNTPLARLYDIDPPAGSDFELVKLTDRRRGGLLGQASVLTVTANGIDTSPVVRGVWLLENILGTPPTSPPPDVEPLDPDVRGAKTIREQLARHRDNASCRDCHRKIDPLGFALENFDPIGRWRTDYGRNLPIDASGELPSGKSFGDVAGFKELLVEQRVLFVRSLSTKLLAYALGRHLNPADRPHIDQIAADLTECGDGFCDLVKLIVLSEAFRSP